MTTNISQSVDLKWFILLPTLFTLNALPTPPPPHPTPPSPLSVQQTHGLLQVWQLQDLLRCQPAKRGRGEELGPHPQYWECGQHSEGGLTAALPHTAQALYPKHLRPVPVDLHLPGAVGDHVQRQLLGLTTWRQGQTGPCGIQGNRGRLRP